MTDSVKVLSDDEVNRLLALSRQNTGPSFGYTHDLCVAVDALCATVRALRELVYVPKILPDDDDVTYRDQVERLLRENTALREQLAQVTQERDRYADALESATKGIKCDD